MSEIARMMKAIQMVGILTCYVVAIIMLHAT